MLGVAGPVKARQQILEEEERRGTGAGGWCSKCQTLAAAWPEKACAACSRSMFRHATLPLYERPIGAVSLHMEDRTWCHDSYTDRMQLGSILSVLTLSAWVASGCEVRTC